MPPKNGLQESNASLVTPPATSEPVAVSFAACRRLAALLKSLSIPADREDTSLPWLNSTQVGNFYLLLVAICHQTSPRGRPPLEGNVSGRNLRGWDYLSAKLEYAVREDPEILLPKSWSEITAEKVRAVFRDPDFGDRLTDPSGRAALIRDLGQKMQWRSWEYAEQLYVASAGHITSGNFSLLGLLSEFRAYQDPVRKKSYFFLALMHNSGLWTYADPDQLGAPIDYHEVRGHLRIGTVEIHDPNLRDSLMAGREVTADQDVRIRKAVHQALMFISEESELRNPSQLHYLFWNVFRSCCSRDSTHCHSCPPTCALPDRYVPLAMFPDGRRCPFSSVCRSTGQEQKLLEQVIDTEYY